MFSLYEVGKLCVKGVSNYQDKYIRLSNIVIKGLGTSGIDEAIDKTSCFYNEQGIDVY